MPLFLLRFGISKGPLKAEGRTPSKMNMKFISLYLVVVVCGQISSGPATSVQAQH